MNNKNVQEKLCTEPKEPEQAFEFAIAFEEGVKRQKAYESHSSEIPKPSRKSKSEPVFAVEKSNPRECFRCGEPNFTMEHVKLCHAANYRCKFGKIVGHTEKSCNKTPPSTKEDGAKAEEQKRTRNAKGQLH